jgi:predicted nucleic acid-binding protein
VIVLDTDVLSIVQRAEGPAYDQLVRRLDAADDEVAVSIVSFAAITLTREAWLISKNLSDFRKVPGLRVEDWTV